MEGDFSTIVIKDNSFRCSMDELKVLCSPHACTLPPESKKLHDDSCDDGSSALLEVHRAASVFADCKININGCQDDTDQPKNLRTFPACTHTPGSEEVSDNFCHDHSSELPKEVNQVAPVCANERIKINFCDDGDHSTVVEQIILRSSHACRVTTECNDLNDNSCDNQNFALTEKVNQTAQLFMENEIHIKCCDVGGCDATDVPRSPQTSILTPDLLHYSCDDVKSGLPEEINQAVSTCTHDESNINFYDDGDCCASEELRSRHASMMTPEFNDLCDNSCDDHRSKLPEESTNAAVQCAEEEINKNCNDDGDCYAKEESLGPLAAAITPDRRDNHFDDLKSVLPEEIKQSTPVRDQDGNLLNFYDNVGCYTTEEIDCPHSTKPTQECKDSCDNSEVPEEFNQTALVYSELENNVSCFDHDDCCTKGEPCCPHASTRTPESLGLSDNYCEDYNSEEINLAVPFNTQDEVNMNFYYDVGSSTLEELHTSTSTPELKDPRDNCHSSGLYEETVQCALNSVEQEISINSFEDGGCGSKDEPVSSHVSELTPESTALRNNTFESHSSDFSEETYEAAVVCAAKEINTNCYDDGGICTVDEQIILSSPNACTLAPASMAISYDSCDQHISGLPEETSQAVPGFPEDEIDINVEKDILDTVFCFINDVAWSPGRFDKHIGTLLRDYSIWEKSKKVATEVSKMIIAKSVSCQNFRYNGARFCTVLLNKSKDTKHCTFWDCLQFELDMEKTVAIGAVDSNHKRIHGLLMFLAELFEQLDLERASLGSEICYIISVLLDKETTEDTENIRCVCQALKLSGRQLDKTYRDSLEEIFRKLMMLIEHENCNKRVFNQITSLVAFRESNWGRGPSPEPLESPTITDVVSESVYCGPDGTDLSVEESRFLEEHLDESAAGDIQYLQELCEVEDPMDELDDAFEEFLRISEQE